MRVRAEVKTDNISEVDHQTAEIANALAHPLRAALVRYLAEKNDGKGVDNRACNKDLVAMFDYSQSTMSQHIKILKDCGLFMAEPYEKFTYYTLNKELLEKFRASLIH